MCWHVSSLSEFWDRLAHSPSKIFFLQVPWSIGPSFILWHVWLERNRRIVHDMQLEIRKLWGNIVNSLQETLLGKCDIDGSLDPIDAGIYSHLSFPIRGFTPMAPHTRSGNSILSMLIVRVIGLLLRQALLKSTLMVLLGEILV